MNDKQKGMCKVKCKITSDTPYFSKGKNNIKMSWCNRNKVLVACKCSNLILRWLTFVNANKANDCLNKLENVANKCFLDRKITTCKDVISDWPYDIVVMG